MNVPSGELENHCEMVHKAHLLSQGDGSLVTSNSPAQRESLILAYSENEPLSSLYCVPSWDILADKLIGPASVMGAGLFQ